MASFHDLQRIVLHPSRARVVLGVLNRRAMPDDTVPVKEARLGGGGTLVHGKDVSAAHWSASIT
jgi:ribosomal protein L18E